MFSLCAAAVSALNGDFVFLPYDSHEQAFAFCLARNEAVDRHAESFEQASADVPGRLRRNVCNLAAEFVYYPPNVLLVLSGVESACGINHRSSVAKAFPSLADNLALQCLTSRNALRAPFLYRLMVFSEHPFA